jgi:hypothetical protein
LTLRASGSGAAGTIDTTVAVTFTDLGDGTTRIEYDADAIVGGMVGGVGQRVLGAVAKRTADAFFVAIDRTFTGAAAGAPAAAPAAAEAALAPTRVVRPTRPGGPWELAAAAAVGALSMLAGVLIGVRIGRRR